jgi:hypothetical protein
MPPTQPARRSRRPWLVGGIVAAVVVLLTCAILGVLIEVAGARLGSATATPTLPTTPTVAPTPTVAAPAGFTGYKDPSGLYTLAYPTGWTKVDGSSGAGIATPVAGGSGFGLVLFGDSTTGSALGVEYLQLSYPNGMAAFDDSGLKGFAGTGKLTNRKGPTQVTIAGETWTQESADTTQGGETEHLVVDGVNHGAYTVAIFYAASSASFASVDSASFQTMVSTFTFLK